MLRTAILWLLSATLCHAQLPSLAKLHCQTAGGSCTLIARGQGQAMWVTAYHVVEGQPERVSVVHSRGTFVGRVAETNPPLDVALVVTSDENLPLEPLKLWTASAADAKRHWAEGYSAYGFGRLTGTNYLPGWREGMGNWEMGPPKSGDSGGVIYTMHQGHPYLTGVLSGGYGRSSDGRGSEGTWGCTIGPLRRWILTLGWRFRRARAQAWQYSGMSLDEQGRLVIKPRSWGRDNPAPYGQPGAT